MPYNANLSDERGGAAGISFFRAFLRIFGVNRACELVWAVSLFYALFDARARAGAAHYLSRRFPGEEGGFRRFFRTWTLFTAQGQALVEAAAMRLGKVEWVRENGELCDELQKGKSGFILLVSHFGCWQGLIGCLRTASKKAAVLVTPDRNGNVDKTLAAGGGLGDGVEFLSTASPMGGIPAACDALAEGKILCVMGDRCMEERGLETDFLGGSARFPAAAFFLAARAGVPVLPLFAVRKKRHVLFHARYEDAIRPRMDGRSREQLLPYLKQYVALLEKYTREQPYQLFLFDDIWEKEK